MIHSAADRDADRLLRAVRAVVSREGWRQDGQAVVEEGRAIAPVASPDLGQAVLEAWDPVALPAAGSGYEVADGAASEHVIAVIARPSLPGGRRSIEAVVLERLCAGTLTELLEDRGGLAAEETATVLIAVARALAAVHSAGAAGVGPAADDVGFREDGCPVIRRLDRAGPLDCEGVLTDAAALRELARALCESASGAAPGGVPDVAGESGGSLLAAVESALLAVDWRQVGVSIDPGAAWEGVVEAIVSVAQPVRVSPGAGAGIAPVEPGHIRSGSAAAALHRPGPRRSVSERVLDALDGNPIARARAALARRLSTRPRLLMAAALPLAVGVVVVALVPASPERGAEPSSTPAASSASAREQVARSEVVRATSPPTPGASGARRGPSPSPSAAASDSSGDPVAATEALLKARYACFLRAGATDAGSSSRGSSPADCLDSVVAAGTDLLETEGAALGRPGAASTRDFAGASVTVTDQWADAVLVTVAPDRERTPDSEPASLLLVRSEAGWRIRAVFP